MGGHLFFQTWICMAMIFEPYLGCHSSIFSQTLVCCSWEYGLSAAWSSILNQMSVTRSNYRFKMWEMSEAYHLNLSAWQITSSWFWVYVAAKVSFFMNLWWINCVKNHVHAHILVILGDNAEILNAKFWPDLAVFVIMDYRIIGLKVKADIPNIFGLVNRNSLCSSTSQALQLP